MAIDDSRLHPQGAGLPLKQETETTEAPLVENERIRAYPPRLQHALDEILPALEDSVRHHMPDGAFREYYLWGLNPANPHHDAWISVIGLKQIVQFTLESVAFPFPDGQIGAFAHYAAPMTIYLNFEVVSDNLEFGLCDRAAHDRTYYLRAHLIREFCNAMCARLSGEPASAAALLAHEAGVAARISAHHQSLSPHKHTSIAADFLRSYPQHTLSQLESGLLPLLIMNIESCVDLARQTRGYQTSALIHKGLYRRYRSAERVFRDPNLDLARVVSYGAYTILIIPVMAYYLEMGANAFGIPDRFRAAVENGQVGRALYQCSVLVRLLNDLGTPVILQTPEQRSDLIDHLRYQARHTSDTNIRRFLRSVVHDQSYRALLARIVKDVEMGDFNIALYNLPHINPLDSALVTFGKRLGALSRIYHRTYDDLQSQLEALNRTLGSDYLSSIIGRVVHFHARMYGDDYRQAEGDYAV
jgi:hypothetical protein